MEIIILQPSMEYLTDKMLYTPDFSYIILLTNISMTLTYDGVFFLIVVLLLLNSGGKILNPGFKRSKSPFLAEGFKTEFRPSW